VRRSAAACDFGKLVKTVESRYIRRMRAIFNRYRSSARQISTPWALLARALPAPCLLAIHRHDQGTLACLRPPR